MLLLLCLLLLFIFKRRLELNLGEQVGGWGSGWRRRRHREPELLVQGRRRRQLIQTGLPGREPEGLGSWISEIRLEIRRRGSQGASGHRHGVLERRPGSVGRSRGWEISRPGWGQGGRSYRPERPPGSPHERGPTGRTKGGSWTPRAWESDKGVFLQRQKQKGGEERMRKKKETLFFFSSQRFFFLVSVPIFFRKDRIKKWIKIFR